jgi:hypothetical protein
MVVRENIEYKSLILSDGVSDVELAGGEPLLKLLKSLHLHSISLNQQFFAYSALFVQFRHNGGRPL